MFTRISAYCSLTFSLFICVLLLLASSACGQSSPEAQQNAKEQEQIEPVVEPRAALATSAENDLAKTNLGDEMEQFAIQSWTGDFDKMVKRRLIRILVPHGKTYYFQDGAVERGVVAEAGQQLEKLLNKKLKTGKRPIDVAFIPVARDELFDGLVEGRGDIAAGGNTITASRKKIVDFTEPGAKGINEVIIGGANAAKLKGLSDLSGKDVYVRKTSSYFESLKGVNEDLASSGKAPINIKLLDEVLEAEEVLEMANAGLISYTVVDDLALSLWSDLFKKITIYPEIKVGSGRDYAWAIRKNSPKLKKELNSFIKKRRQGTEFGNIMIKRYFKNHKWMKNPNASAERKRFQKLVKYFRKYGEKYDFDYLLLTAQGYQESKLNQKLKSPVGAIGVMQLMPRTGKSMEVGDIHKVESNIHAGTKYLRFVADKYFNDEEISPLDRMLFSFASYNAGPTRVSKLRRQATKLGLDKNKWFNNVELIVAKRVGREPVRYVRNIYKYYLAYRMAQKINERKIAARKN